ncbi:MAG: putative RDD family membrane protein YckC [Halioglobus sp.]|jgi:uncharacterized RDD family membrane protein YckC
MRGSNTGFENVKLSPMTTPSALPSPSLMRRLTAILYDALLVIALIAVVNGLALGIVVKASAGQQELLHPAWVQLLTAFSVISFFTLFWCKSGQTLGMQAWRIQLVSSGGGKPSVVQAVIRCIVAAVSAACLGLGYLWCLKDPQKLYWHDHASKTQLILLPKRDKSASESAEA